MSDRAGIWKDYRRDFVLDEGKLRKITSVLKSHGAKLSEKTFIRFRVNRDNDSFYETADIEEVLTDDNTTGRAIKMLCIELHRGDATVDPADPQTDRRNALALVLFSRFGEDEKVNLVVQERERDWCFLFADELDTQVQRTLRRVFLPPAFPLRLFDTVGGLVAGAITVWLLVYFRSSLWAPPTLDQIQTMSIEDRTASILEWVSGQHGELIWFLPAMCVLFGGIVVVMGLRPISRVLEKRTGSVFYWGDMVGIYDASRRRMAKLKWGVAIAFIVSLLAGIVGGILV